MNEVVNIFKALSDSNRIRILKMLETRLLCVCEIREVLNLANSTVSKHLSILKEVGLIGDEKEGKWVNYHLNIYPADSNMQSIQQLIQNWLQDDKQIKTDQEKIASLDRYQLCKL